MHLDTLAQIILVLALVLSLWPRPNADTARAFLSPAVGTLALSALGSLAPDVGPPWRAMFPDIALIALLFHPFFLLRLVSVLDAIRPRLLWAVGLGTGALVVLASLTPELPAKVRVAIPVVLAVFFLGVEAYGTLRLWQAASRGAGSARARALTLAVASGGVAVLLLFLLAASLVHAGSLPAAVAGALTAAIALLYLVAVAPPAWLRHAWQMQAILHFYEAGSTVVIQDERAVTALLLETAMAATGSVGGGVDEREADRPVFMRTIGRGAALEGALAGAVLEVGPDDPMERAWQTGRVQVAAIDPARPTPGLAPSARVRRLLVVPVQAGGDTLAVLRLFTPVAWLFLQDDLALLEVLVEHAGALHRMAQARAQELAAAATLRDANRALEAASTAKSDFLSGMSHELRTPLNAIIGFSDLLLQPQAGDLSERQGRYVGNILESGQHLLQIVNDVLDIAKADAARLDIRPTAIRVATVVEAGLLLVQPQARAGGVALVNESDAEVWLNGDELRVRQVLVNLLSNAVKFTPQGGSVTVRTARSEGFVEITVEDTGIGIEQGDLAAVFDEFTQVSHGTDRAYEGTGLGLPLVRRLVQAMGGGVRAESTPGVGSAFTVWFPAVAPAATGPREAVSTTQADGERGPVLVVDDDRMARELCRQTLGQVGYAVDAVGSLAAARESIASRPPRLVILDILLGEEYGDGLFDAIETLEPRPRVIVASIVDQGRHPLPGEVDAWLVKPVRPDGLLRAVAQALGEPTQEVVGSHG